MLAQHKKYVERRKPATVFRFSETCKKMKDKTNAHLDDYVRNYKQNAHFLDIWEYIINFIRLNDYPAK